MDVPPGRPLPVASLVLNLSSQKWSEVQENYHQVARKTQIPPVSSLHRRGSVSVIF